MHVLPSNLAAVSLAAGGHLTNVHLVTNETEYRVEATTGKIAVSVTGEYPAKPDEVDVQDSMLAADHGNEVLIPSDQWKKIFAAASKIKGIPKYRNVPVTVGRNAVQFA